MTKGKARQRAKAKALQKARKRKASTEHPGQNIRAGQFDPGASSIMGPVVSANAKSFGEAKPGGGALEIG